MQAGAPVFVQSAWVARNSIPLDLESLDLESLEECNNCVHQTTFASQTKLVLSLYSPSDKTRSL